MIRHDVQHYPLTYKSSRNVTVLYMPYRNLKVHHYLTNCMSLSSVITPCIWAMCIIYQQTHLELQPKRLYPHFMNVTRCQQFIKLVESIEAD